MTMVSVYSTGQREKLGAHRWTVTWWALAPSAEGKAEVDFDRDLVEYVHIYQTRNAAMRKAGAMVEWPKNFHGVCRVQEQIVAWSVEADHVAEWADTGDFEEIS
jgi:hypothetical protein